MVSNREVENIWIIEEIYISAPDTVMIKHINNQLNKLHDTLYISKKYLITLDVVRNNKIDKLLK